MLLTQSGLAIGGFEPLLQATSAIVLRRGDLSSKPAGNLANVGSGSRGYKVRIVTAGLRRVYADM
jgi:hypothetical protein